MLSFIIYLAGIWTYHIAQSQSVQKAFIYAYIPILLLLPEYFQAITPGLPDPTFSQASSAGLFAVFIMKGSPGYRFSNTDIVVGVFALSVAISQYLALGYADAQNLMFNQLTSVFFPYIFAKSLIEPFNLRYDFAKTLVLCLCVVFIGNLYENKMGINLWQMLLARFFPGQGSGWVTTFRFGLARASGPYGHCLVDGIMMAVGYRFQRWLQWSEAWPVKIKQLDWVPWFSPSQIFSLMIFGGVISTLGKGQWLAGIVGAAVVIIGRFKNRSLALSVVLTVMIVVGVPALIGFLDYASVGRANALDANQETACYRYELIELYMDIAAQHMWFGWGLMNFPDVPGAESIDNNFLLVYLNHGLIAVSILLGIIFVMMVRLIRHGMSQPFAEPKGSSLAFTLAAIYLMYFIATATVAMMYQSGTMFFIIIGLSDAYLMSSNSDINPSGSKNQVIIDTRKFKFRRVI